MSATVPSPASPPAAASVGLMRRDGVLARLARDRIALAAAIVLGVICIAALFRP